MDAVDETHFAGPQGQDDGRGSRAFAEEAYAAHEGAVGYAGGGKDELLAGSQVFGFVDTFLVFDTHLRDAFFELGLVDDQSPLHVAVQATDSGCSDHAFRRST